MTLGHPRSRSLLSKAFVLEIQSTYLQFWKKILLYWVYSDLPNFEKSLNFVHKKFQIFQSQNILYIGKWYNSFRPLLNFLLRNWNNLYWTKALGLHFLCKLFSQISIYPNWPANCGRWFHIAGNLKIRVGFWEI